MEVIEFLLVGLVCLGGFFAVVALLSTDKGRRSYMVPVIFGGAVILLLFVGTRCASNSDVEWNPTIRDDAVVVGTWKDEKQTLVLDTDHTFLYRAAVQTFRGNWKRENWSLALSGDHFSRGMAFVRVRGRYRLISSNFDPDGWDDSMGLRQTQR